MQTVNALIKEMQALSPEDRKLLMSALLGMTIADKRAAEPKFEVGQRVSWKSQNGRQWAGVVTHYFGNWPCVQADDQEYGQRIDPNSLTII